MHITIPISFHGGPDEERIELPASHVPRNESDSAESNDASSDDGDKNVNTGSVGPDLEGSGGKDDSPAQQNIVSHVVDQDKLFVKYKN